MLQIYVLTCKCNDMLVDSLRRAISKEPNVEKGS